MYVYPVCRPDLVHVMDPTLARVQELSTVLAFHKPADPVAFLLEHLRKVQAFRASHTHSGFFTDVDLEALFALQAGPATTLTPPQVPAVGPLPSCVPSCVQHRWLHGCMEGCVGE